MWNLVFRVSCSSGTKTDDSSVNHVIKSGHLVTLIIHGKLLAHPLIYLQNQCLCTKSYLNRRTPCVIKLGPFLIVIIMVSVDVIVHQHWTCVHVCKKIAYAHYGSRGPVCTESVRVVKVISRTLRKKKNNNINKEHLYLNPKPHRRNARPCPKLCYLLWKFSVSCSTVNFQYNLEMDGTKQQLTHTK